MLPSLIGVSGCVLLCGLGLSSVMSVRFPYPTVRPGDSPFAQPQSSATAATWMQSLTVLAILALVTPSVVLAFLGFEFGARVALRVAERRTRRSAGGARARDRLGRADLRGARTGAARVRAAQLAPALPGPIVLKIGA